MSNGPVLDRLRTHWLAACCIFAPLFFGFLALDQAASLLTSSADKIQLPYQFPSIEDVSLSALDLHGRTLYAIASAFLYLASASALLFGFIVVLRRNGFVFAALALVLFTGIGVVIAFLPSAIEKLRPLVVEQILAEATRQLDAKILGSFGNDVSGFGTLLRSLSGLDQGHPGATAVGLVRLNAVIGLVSVGILLSALASVSVLRSEEKWSPEDKLRDLRSRRMIIRLVLALGSVVLVVAVIASKLLIEWPTSLLIKSQQIAIAPLGEALNLLFAASCTLCLIAAIGPALVAFLMDKHEFLKVPSKASPTPETATAVELTPTGLKQIEDDLGFAPLPSIGGVIAVFSPLLTPHLMELITFIIGLHSSSGG